MLLTSQIQFNTTISFLFCVCVCEHTTIKFRVSSFVRAAGRSYGCTVATPRPRPTRIPLHAWKLERPCGGAAAGGSTARSAGRAAAAGLAVVRPGVAERAGELKARTVPVIINKGSHTHMAAPCASAGDAAAAEPPCLSSPHWPPPSPVPPELEELAAGIFPSLRSL